MITKYKWGRRLAQQKAAHQGTGCQTLVLPQGIDHRPAHIGDAQLHHPPPVKLPGGQVFPQPQGRAGEQHKQRHSKPGRLVDDIRQVHAAQQKITVCPDVGGSHMNGDDRQHGHHPRRVQLFHFLHGPSPFPSGHTVCPETFFSIIRHHIIPSALFQVRQARPYLCSAAVKNRLPPSLHAVGSSPARERTLTLPPVGSMIE